MTHGGQPFDWDRQAPTGSLPELLLDDARYTGGLTFALRGYQVRHDGSQILGVAGLDRGETVGFDLCLGSEWKDAPSLAGTILAVQLGSVILRSVGAPSDALVRLLDRLYQAVRQADRMKSSIPLIGLALGGDPANLQAGTTRIKLTHRPAMATTTSSCSCSSLLPWMEQGSDLAVARIGRPLARSLELVAAVAGDAEVIRHRSSARDERDDVLDDHRDAHYQGAAAVRAPLAVLLRDVPPQRSRDPWAARHRLRRGGYGVAAPLEQRQCDRAPRHEAISGLAQCR